MDGQVGAETGQRRWSPRSSILVRLVLAFALIGVLPVAVLALLSLREVSVDVSGSHAEGGAEPASGVTAPAADSVGGVPIAFIELGVAGVSLALGVAWAIYIGRTIVRPLRSLEASMHRVETGDLEVVSNVRSNDEIGHLAAAFNRMVDGLRREAMVRELFGQYVSPAVARMAIEQGGHVEGQVVECTVLFVDIRRFTGLAEVLPPARLIGTLNRYFEQMLPAVEAEGGIVNKFGGDSLLAVFGSPLNPAADHAARAIRTALGMREALRTFNREQAASEMPELRVGFGIATGEVIAGNVGSSRKLEYTVIGDAVNLAARLQELTRELGSDILVSSATARAAEGVGTLRSLGQIEIRGRAERIEVFSVTDTDASVGVASAPAIAARSAQSGPP